MSKTLGCRYEAPTFGARYPDGTCIDGWMWDLDSGDGDELTSGGDVPCPWCNTRVFIEHCGPTPSGNARQRRKAYRAKGIKNIREWALKRSTFHPETGVYQGRSHD